MFTTIPNTTFPLHKLLTNIFLKENEAVGNKPFINKQVMCAILEKHSIKIANRSFEDAAKFKYQEARITGQSCMHEEIRAD
jgi:hypothetical protein